MAQIRFSSSLFLFGRAGAAAGSCHIHTRHQMPPRRRAFRSNDFGVGPITIPRDAKRQAEPLSRRERISTKIIPASIPHACSSDPTSVSRRAAHTLVSMLSRAAGVGIACREREALEKRCCLSWPGAIMYITTPPQKKNGCRKQSAPVYIRDIG